MSMFSNPKDDPWASQNKDDDDDWDTDPDFENKDTIKKGKQEEIVSAADAQRRLRGELDEERATKFGLPKPVAVERGQWDAPAPTGPSPAKAWNPQQELAGKTTVSAARNAFNKPAVEDPPPRSAPSRAPAPKPAPAVQAPKPAAPAPKAAAPPPAPKPVVHAPPPPPAPVEEQWDQSYDQGGDQGGYDQGYDQSGYDQGGDQGGYDQGGDQGGYDQGYDQGGYDQGYDQSGGAALGQCRAIYDYEGETATDLKFKEGDIISLLNDSDPSGWWEGELNGLVGYFPSNFVQRI